MPREQIYCLPGLGLDHRLFSRLKLRNAELHFIDWLAPQDAEDLKAYSKRIAELLPTHPISLLGVSLGGIVSIEIAKIRTVNHLFLISTIKNRNEMPSFLKWMNRFPINSKQMAHFAMNASVALKPFYDKADKEGNLLFKEMVQATQANFINWGVNQIAQWDNTAPLNADFTHIHGTEDLIFPIKNIDRAITIKGGTHFAIYNDAEKISAIIDDLYRNEK